MGGTGRGRGSKGKENWDRLSTSFGLKVALPICNLLVFAFAKEYRIPLQL